jgi:alkylhydroperoxidase family enzyme
MSKTPFRAAADAYHAAERRYNTLPAGLENREPAFYGREQQAYFTAFERVCATPCADLREVADAFMIACDNGASLLGDEITGKLVEDIKRLRGEGVA